MVNEKCSPIKGDQMSMRQTQLQRVRMMGFGEAGKKTLREATHKMRWSHRQARRIGKLPAPVFALLAFDTSGKSLASIME
jgi:hypothetical protein